MTNPADTCDVASPCVRDCCLDEADVCVGCFRSIAEILAWAAADSSERRSILDRAAARRRRWEETLGAAG